MRGASTFAHCDGRAGCRCCESGSVSRGSPLFAVRKTESGQRLGKDFNTVSGVLWHKIMSAMNPDGIEKVFVQMADVFEDTIFE